MKTDQMQARSRHQRGQAPREFQRRHPDVSGGASGIRAPTEAANSDATAPVPLKLAAVHGLDEQLCTQDRAAPALRMVRHTHGALGLKTLEVRALFDDGALADLLPDVRVQVSPGV